jgi:O-antigen ligase
MGLYLSLVVGSLVCMPWANDAFGMVKVAVALVGVALMWASGRAHRTQMDGQRAGELQASAHNDILQFWATTGIVGLAAYLWAWHRALLVAWKAPPVFGSLVALFVAAKFNPVPPAALYLCAALLGAVAVAGKPSRAIWAIGAAVLLFAPGLAVHLTIADGSGVVHARVR